MNTLQICPSHVSYVATLPWEIQKSHFSTLFIYRVLQIIYVTSEENKIATVVQQL